MAAIPEFARILLLDPHHNEGPQHLLMRTAQARVLTVNDLLTEGVAYCIDLLPVPKRSDFPNSANFAATQWHLENSRHAWLNTHSRCCPHCIEERSGMNSIGWELRFADACTVHKTWLVDRCTCGAFLRTTRTQLHLCCACGRKLSGLSTSLAPNAVVS